MHLFTGLKNKTARLDPLENATPSIAEENRP